MKNLIVIITVLLGITFFSSCEKQELELNSVEIENNLDLPFVVSNENGVLNFETKTDYELALSCLVELETNGELGQFEKKLGFDSYRSTFQCNQQKMNDIQDDILATFLNPSNKVIIEQKMFEINLVEDRVFVWEHQDGELKSAQDELLIGEFRCDQDVFDLLEGGAVLKSVQGSYCDGNHEGWIVPINYGNNYHNDFDVNVDYIKAGLYYTLNARIRQTGDNQTEIGLRTDNCSYTKKSGSTYTFSKDESGFNWERNFRPYWGLQRLKAYTFEVDFYFLWNNNTEYGVATVNNECQK